MLLTNHSSAFLLHDVRVVKNVACLSSLLIATFYPPSTQPLCVYYREHVTPEVTSHMEQEVKVT